MDPPKQVGRLVHPAEKRRYSKLRRLANPSVLGTRRTTFLTGIVADSQCFSAFALSGFFVPTWQMTLLTLLGKLDVHEQIKLSSHPLYYLPLPLSHNFSIFPDKHERTAPRESNT